MNEPDDDICSTEYWRDIKKFKQEKRANNRERSAKILEINGVQFVSKNGGAHLIVDERYDFWPGTGLWIERGKPQTHRGVYSLLKRLKRFSPKIL